MLRCARLFHIPHAAVDLHTDRGHIDTEIRAVGFCNWRQKTNPRMQTQIFGRGCRHRNSPRPHEPGFHVD